MSTSELVPFGVPPIAISCGMCGQEMKLVSVERTAIDIIYRFECTKGHPHEMIMVDS